MATPMAQYMRGTRNFDPTLEFDKAASVYARDHEEARILLDDALDYVELASEDADKETRACLDAVMNLAGAALEFLEEKAKEEVEV